jgi:hypothetical protein
LRVQDGVSRLLATVDAQYAEGDRPERSRYPG